MRKLILAASMAVMGTAGAAHAAMVDWAALYGGVSIDPPLQYGCCEYDMDSGLNVGGVLGWNLDQNLSLGVDLMYTEQGYSGYSSKLETMSVMADVFYSFDIGSKWRPFVGAGIGGVQVTYDNNGSPFAGSDFVFGWEATAGVTIPIAAKTDISLSYKYQGSEDAQIETRSVEYKSNTISAGLVFNLN